ncbi:nuclear transport factor 2 family protein [Streptomyces lunaelactis]|uniref:nuclear transport factor 2 family protein n=1 Tax=Streptomyces lunaelactis TaxID=1535768 RepID=UPI001584D951|nr:nuclear transport factor 2 family protein [Streptomyces lunaelactis]NUJ99805.1 nuclear transport factor 2 family protein [Streptomyces lunaelactis]NUK13927.1 nuclear transport factor 2 family protein [Streptomyces lunaelactis]NUK48785.1 nuclear transport factor 2 family protein [Streptomyces lunaelactis]NUK62568.1 nuclear transport factor 2 family protein [Streptomyces lunaelactis]
MTDPTEAVNAAMEAEFRLLDPAVRSSPELLAELFHPDYQEFGSSGRVWDRDAIIAVLTARDAPAPRPITTSRMQGVQLAPDVVHLTFDTESGTHCAHRSSLWRLTGGRWLLYFHQGTRFSGGGGTGSD